MSVNPKSGSGLFGAAELTPEDDIFLHRLNAASLPEVDEAQDDIIALIDELSEAVVSPSERHGRFNALARYVVLEIHHQLGRDNTQHLALDPEANNEIKAILKIVNRLLASLHKASTVVGKKLQSMSLYVQLELLLATVVLYAECQRRLPAGFWIYVHEVFRLVEHSRLIKFKCRSEDRLARYDGSVSPTLGQLYTLTILHGLTDLTELNSDLAKHSPVDSPRCSSRLLHKMLHCVVGQITIKSYSSKRALKTDYLQVTVDLQSDTPFLVERGSTPDSTWIRCLDLVSLSRNMVKVLLKSDDLSADLFLSRQMRDEPFWHAMTDILLEHWTVRQYRGVERVAVDQGLYAVVGFSSSVEIIETLSDEPIDSVLQSDRTVLRATAVDSSDSGLRVRCPVRDLTQVDEGELIIWCEHQQAANHVRRLAPLEEWQAGTVRWVKNQDGHMVDLGIVAIDGTLSHACLGHTAFDSDSSDSLDPDNRVLIIVTLADFDAIRALVICPNNLTEPRDLSHITVGPVHYTLHQMDDKQATSCLQMFDCIFTRDDV